MITLRDFFKIHATPYVDQVLKFAMAQVYTDVVRGCKSRAFPSSVTGMQPSVSTGKDFE